MNTNLSFFNKPDQAQTKAFNKLPYFIILYASLILFNGLTTAILRGPAEALSPFALFEENLPQQLILFYFIFGASLVVYSIPFYIGAFGLNKLRLWSWYLLFVSSVLGIVAILGFYLLVIASYFIGKGVNLRILLSPFPELILLLIFSSFLLKSKKYFDSSQQLVKQLNLILITSLSIIFVIGIVSWSKYSQIQMFNKLQTDIENLAKEQQRIKLVSPEPSLAPGISIIEIGVPTVFAERLQNGNTLLAGYNGWIVEVNKSGNIVWEYGQRSGLNNLKKVLNATRLPNGNTLISDGENKRIIEVTSSKEVVWEWGDPVLMPRFVQRLTNGNTLITALDDMGGNTTVLEVLPTCSKTLCPSRDIVWSYSGGKSNAFVQATRLQNGNTLIVSARIGGDGIIEVNSKGEVIWQYGRGRSFSNAYRLKDGNTLIAQNYCSNCEEGYVFIVNNSGNLLWHYDDKTIIGEVPSFSIYPTETETILITANYKVYEIDKSTGNIVWGIK